MPSNGGKPARAKYDYTLDNEEPDLAEKTLNEILLSKGRLWERGTPTAVISLWRTPVGHKETFRMLAGEAGRSKSQIMAITAIHGLSIIRKDPRYTSYEPLLQKLTGDWMKLRRPVRSLEDWQPFSIVFKLASPQVGSPTTFRLPEEYAGAVEEVADDLALATSSMAIIASQVSLSTLKADLGFLEWVRQDVTSFWAYFSARENFLKGMVFGAEAVGG